MTSATLANKSHPVTKQLEKLFNQLKEQGALDSFYGSQSLDEFVAEAMSNPEFRSHLSGMRVGEANAFVTFMRHVANIIRKLVGLDTKPVDT